MGKRVGYFFFYKKGDRGQEGVNEHDSRRGCPSYLNPALVVLMEYINFFSRFMAEG
jgi:hypothetical protein